MLVFLTLFVCLSRHIAPIEARKFELFVFVSVEEKDKERRAGTETGNQIDCCVIVVVVNVSFDCYCQVCPVALLCE